MLVYSVNSVKVDFVFNVLGCLTCCKMSLLELNKVIILFGRIRRNCFFKNDNSRPFCYPVIPFYIDSFSFSVYNSRTI